MQERWIADQSDKALQNTTTQGAQLLTPDHKLVNQLAKSTPINGFKLVKDAMVEANVSL